MAYILDTDWAIQALAGIRPAVTILDRVAPQRVSVSVVTIGEVHEGAYSSPNPRARLAQFQVILGRCVILPVTEPIMVRFAEIRAFLRRRGLLISDFDMIIGATALEYDLTVLTFNVRHFSRIPDLRLYSSSS